MPAEDIPHAGAFREALEVGLRVRPVHLDAALGERRHGGTARAGEAEDRRGVDLGQVGSERERHRSFNVESAKSAKTIATIQNRMMTFDSGHPASSKWWWSGAIRKMRLPRSLKEPTCRITEAVSATNTPRTRTSRISCLMSTATVPSPAPSASEPVSPMKTSAGCALDRKSTRLNSSHLG